MLTRKNVPQGLDYLRNKPRIINWKVIAGPLLHPIQMYDVVYDEHDLKIRRMDTPANLKAIRKKKEGN